MPTTSEPKKACYTEHEEYQASLRTNSLVHERVKQNSCLYQVTHTFHQKSKGPPLVQAGYLAEIFRKTHVKGCRAKAVKIEMRPWALHVIPVPERFDKHPHQDQLSSPFHFPHLPIPLNNVHGTPEKV